MAEPQAVPVGLLASLKTLSTSLLSIVQTRLELLSTDVAEERERLVILLVAVLGALFCLGVGLVLLAMLIVVAFWDTHRLAALATLTAVFLSAGAGAGWLAVYKLRSQPRPFAASLSELSKDRAHLTADS